MATYEEIAGLFNDPTLTAKVGAACVDVSDDIAAEPVDTANHANRLKWAKKVYTDPETTRIHMLKALLGASVGLTLQQIIDASDATIKTAVASRVNVFADGS